MFETHLNAVDLKRLQRDIYSASFADVERVLHKQHCTPEDFPVLISPAAADFIETLAARSRQITTLRFGKIMRLYAPLYISNECVNACAYCGFNVHNATKRTTLNHDEVLAEADVLHQQGFRHLLLVSGHYEGFDERVREQLADDELSIGDYVLTNGALPVMVIIDAVTRLLPGVLGDEQSAHQDSFSHGLLEYPQYTRPADFRGMKVPEVLLSGNHAEIARWQAEQARLRTKERRPDLLQGTD